jgi:small subunit ribosomal protein S1
MDSAAESAEHPMNFVLSDDFDLGFPQVGEIREGQVVAHRPNEILVDIGAKSEGIISGREVETMDPETREMLAVGNVVPVYIIDPDDQDGNIILSFSKAMEEEDWQKAQDLMESQEVYEGRVIGYNKGGVLVRLGRVRGFVPASQLSSTRKFSNARNSTEDRLREIVGEKILTRVIEVDRSRNRLILSERAATKEIREAQRAKLLEELHEGDVRDGRVVNLADFGAFVDIGGLEGLVHLSELSWKRVNHPSEVLKLGGHVKVYVLNVDRERNRVALSLKKLEADPWTNINNMYQEGQLVEVTITKLTKYGAFARLDDDYELEGLIHISEMSDDRVNHPRDIVHKDQVVTARIIRIDPDQRQLGLSIKQVMSDQYMDADLAYFGDAEGGEGHIDDIEENFDDSFEAADSDLEDFEEEDEVFEDS